MRMIDAVAQTVIDNAEEFGRIDAIAGDGDHGIGMERRGRRTQGGEKDPRTGAGAGTVLQFAADAWADEAGGTSGAIWGVILNTLGITIGNDEKPDAARVALAIAQANAGVMHFGKANLETKRWSMCCPSARR
jgi:dihydroxyacetone kinase